MNTHNGSLRLFRFLGVTVYAHWYWLLLFAYEFMKFRSAPPGEIAHLLTVSLAEYVALFAIVLTHEYGHALACKSVGGVADRIVLWPLGGLAFVQPPPRPGAHLWATFAGPLVNIVLLPLTLLPAIYLGSFAHGIGNADFLGNLALINISLLVFNILPIYPLDGGQMLFALCWFFMSRGTSLIVAAVVGIIGAAGLVVLALAMGGEQGIWLGVIIAFMASQSFNAIRVGRAMRRMENAPRHPEATCPGCHQHPLAAPLWACQCGAHFDTFATGHRCPNCGQSFSHTSCPQCHASSTVAQWYPNAPAAGAPGTQAPIWASSL